MDSKNVNRGLRTEGAVTEKTMNASSTAPLTNSPTRLSGVEFNTNEYEREHNRMPRGRGGWGFVAYEFSRANNYLDHVKWFNGTYQDAKRQARAAFAAEGVMEVVVCS